MKPCILLNLDLQKTEQAQSLTFLQASTPAVLVKVYQDGQLYTGLNGYTATLKFGDDLTPTAGWVTVTSASTNPSAGAFLFEFSAGQTNTSGAFKAVVQILDGAGGKFYFGTVSLAIKECTANTGAAELDLGDEVDWSGSSYVATATDGPYRAGTNVTFTENPDGSVSIAAASASVADGAVTTAKLADLAVTTAKLAAGAATEAKIADGAVATAKVADLAITTGKLAAAAVTVAKLADAVKDAFVGVNGDSGNEEQTVAQHLTLSAGVTTGGTSLLAGTVKAPIVITLGSEDFLLGTTASVGYVPNWEPVDNGTRSFTLDGLRSGAASLQAFSLRSRPIRLPFGFGTFKTTGTIKVTFIADTTNVAHAKLTLCALHGYSGDLTGSKSVLFTDSTVLSAGSANVPTKQEFDRADFNSTTPVTWMVFELEGAVMNGNTIGILAVEIAAEAT